MVLTSLFSALGSRLGGFVSHLLALVFAPLLNKVREIFIPVPPPAPAPFLLNLEASIARLTESNHRLSDQVEFLRGLLEARDGEIQFEVTIRELPRRS